jgi:hypothetical protein
MLMKIKLPTLKKRCYKKGNDYFNNDSFWLILSNYEMLVLPEYRDAGWKEALMISYASGGSTPEIPISG